MRIAALGRTRALWNTINSLVASGHEICLIATCRSAPEYTVKEEDFRDLAMNLGVPFLLTQNLNSPEAIEQLRSAQAEIAISVNWISIIGKEACELLPFGILNAHAGDLPRYRGNAPVAWAILQGEKSIGITIHQMDPHELDAGPIVLKDYFPVSDETYVGEVFEFFDSRVPEMFVEAITGLGAGNIVPQPQPTDPSLSLRCYPRRPEDGLIHWGQPADSIARLVRASAEPFSGAFTFLQSERLIIWRARPQIWPSPSLAVPGQVVWRDTASGEIGVAAGDGVLILQEIEINHGRSMPATIIKSLRERLGLERTS